jgi:hypothetical protein
MELGEEEVLVEEEFNCFPVVCIGSGLRDTQWWFMFEMQHQGCMQFDQPVRLWMHSIPPMMLNMELARLFELSRTGLSSFDIDLLLLNFLELYTEILKYNIWESPYAYKSENLINFGIQRIYRNFSVQP